MCFENAFRFFSFSEETPDFVFFRFRRKRPISYFFVFVVQELSHIYLQIEIILKVFPANIYSYLSSEIRLDLGNLIISTFSDEIFGLVLVSDFEIKSRPVFGLEVVYFW